jgi:hypothetical protein
MPLLGWKFDADLIWHASAQTTCNGDWGGCVLPAVTLAGLNHLDDLPQQTCGQRCCSVPPADMPARPPIRCDMKQCSRLARAKLVRIMMSQQLTQDAQAV